MKPVLVYVFAGERYMDHALKFVASYQNAPGGIDHSTLIVCNGVPADGFAKALFAALPEVSFLEHDNSGWDIGAFQAASQHLPNTVAVFCGASAWFPRPGWMVRVVQSSMRRGLGIFGCMGNAGDARFGVSPHIRTTGFWLTTELMNRYPLRVKDAGLRYSFEHGPNCLTSWITGQGMPAYVVSWDGEYMRDAWDHIPNGFHRGDQSAVMIRDRLCDPPYY